MSNYFDELVNNFVRTKFQERWSNVDFRNSELSTESRRAIQHQLRCSDSIATVMKAEWECGCWSEVTREDLFVVTFIVSCNCGVYYHVHTSLDLGHENLMEQLSEYDDLENSCRYEGAEYDYE